MKKLSARMLAARRRREQRHLKKVFAYVGSQSALARAFDIKPQAVQQWLKKGVPPKRLRPLERLTRGLVQCEQLREDYVEEDRPYRQAGAQR
jgi:DNA-binding transcriptional regulator YdaS (Cro superfamily)